MEGAIDWICRAQAVTSDGGISKGYSLLHGRWSPSYPETTGYTIPTLLDAAVALQRPELGTLAVGLADWLRGTRTPEGGVAHFQQLGQGNARPVVFDTGQALFGWLAAWRETADDVHLQAATKAADWLVSVQSEDGSWVGYQHLDTVKVIDTRVAWPLLEVAQVAPASSYVEAARRNLDWALSQQEANGSFRQAGFRPGQDPFTHTIAYTAEGLLESGLLLDEPRYVTAAEKVARVLLGLQRQDGSLASTYDEEWRPTSPSSCLTGNCQMAIVWLRFFGLSGDSEYLDAARRAVAFVCATQDLHTSHANLRGAIAGSYPIYGLYERLIYPNWAAKFFVDALLALESTAEGPSA